MWCRRWSAPAPLLCRSASHQAGWYTPIIYTSQLICGVTPLKLEQITLGENLTVELSKISFHPFQLYNQLWEKLRNVTFCFRGTYQRASFRTFWEDGNTLSEKKVFESLEASSYQKTAVQASWEVWKGMSLQMCKWTLGLQWMLFCILIRD